MKTKNESLKSLLARAEKVLKATPIIWSKKFQKEIEAIVMVFVKEQASSFSYKVDEQRLATVWANDKDGTVLRKWSISFTCPPSNTSAVWGTEELVVWLIENNNRLFYKTTVETDRVACFPEGGMDNLIPYSRDTFISHIEAWLKDLREQGTISYR